MQALADVRESLHVSAPLDGREGAEADPKSAQSADAGVEEPPHHGLSRLQKFIHTHRKVCLSHRFPEVWGLGV